MDSHYEQVMRARQSLSSAAPRLYFAYSTILDRAAFEEWRGQHSYEFFDLPQGRIAQAIDVGLVFDFPSRWWGGRVAGLQDQPGATVFGVLYEIAGQDWPIIQHKEGAITGMCVERTVNVRAGEQTLEATAFTTNPQRAREDGPISRAFVEALVRGAESASLPADYIARLRTL